MITKNDPIKAMMNIEYCPPEELVKRNIDITAALKFPLDNIVTLGAVFNPLMQLANFAATGSGKSGLYFARTNGKTMFKSGGEFIGSLASKSGGVGGGQAKFSPIPLDPASLCMAIAIFAIEKKLAAINEAQKEILAFFEIKEEAKMKGNLNVLTDVINNYKFNSDNEKYKNNKHILVQDIRREAEQSIIFYTEQLIKILGKNARLFNDKDAKNLVDKITTRLNDYQLALYIFSFASFLEVMLLENFDTNYLNNIESKIKKYVIEYKAVHDKCAEKCEKDSKTSLKGTALKALSKISHGTGKLVEKTPLINRFQLDENLIKVGADLKEADASRTKNLIQVFAEIQTDYISPFIENIHLLDALYNQPSQLMFDEGNIYLMQNDGFELCRSNSTTA